jgi:hypothetical protein
VFVYRRLIKLCYDIAYLESRVAAGMRLTAPEEQRLDTLSELMANDPGYGRRRHRRLRVEVDASVRIGARTLPVRLRDLSGSGVSLSTDVLLPPGTTLQLKIDLDGKAQYAFPCRVLRALASGNGCELALAFEGIPLELRLHRSPPPQLLYRAAS